MVKAIFFDIDGTLVSFKNHQIPETTKQALKALREKDIKIFIATGRSPSQLSVLKEYIDFEFDGYIAMNGQYCFNQKEVIHKQTVSKEDIESILPYLEERSEIACSFVEVDYVYFNQANEKVNNLWAKLGTAAPKLYVDEAVRALTQPTYQLSIYITEDEEEEVLRYLPNCKAARWHPTFTDIIPKDGGKNTGIGKVLEYYDIDLTETMAFGDGGNDKDMLQYVNIGVAMGNATDDVKAVADYITSEVDDDGIMNALKHFKII